MEVPIGFPAKLWSFLMFLPFFFLLLILGLLKAVLIAPVVMVLIGIGNSAEIIGLWPAHVIWTYHCVLRTKRLGLLLKIVVLGLLPFPMLLWPVIGIVGNFLGGIGYGFFAPLIATFEAAGPNFRLRCHHCFADGCLSTIKGSCTAVRDFTDFCFHSYFSYMDELIEKLPGDEHPVNIKLLKLPSCLLAIMIGVPVDVLFISVVALWKSPYMLIMGWKRLLEDLIGREGPFLETVCVPFAGLAIILWPLAVVGAVTSATISSFFFGLHSAVIVYQEDSLLMGLAYVVSVISVFAEYVNDLLYLREGSCLPRPNYRRNMSPSYDRAMLSEADNNALKGRSGGSFDLKLVSERSGTLKCAMQQYRPMQVWDWLFKSCEVNGRILLCDGLLNMKDTEECLVKGDCRKLGIKFPAWSILQCLLVSAKSNLSGLVIADDVELTRVNGPRDKVFEWFIGPLLIMKEQIKKLQLNEGEEKCLKKLIMEGKNKTPEDWDDIGFPSSDHIRKAQLQAIIRRLEGIVASMSRFPTFRRRLRNLMKMLYVEALQASASASHVGEISKSKYNAASSNWKGADETANKAGEEANISGSML